MRIIKKIFNKILFAAVVGIVFVLFNRCQVKAAVLGDNLVEGSDYDKYTIAVDQLDDTWQLIGQTFSHASYNPQFNFYINRNNKHLIGAALPSGEYLNVIEFYDFDINNFALFSSTNGPPKLLLTESNIMPVFGGNCASGVNSFCFTFINNGNVGDYQSATIYGNTIYIDYFYVNTSNNIYNFSAYGPYAKKMTCDNDVIGCYVGLGSTNSTWSFSGQNSLNSVYFVSNKIKNKSQYEAVNQFVVEREEPVIDTPTLRFSPNYVKVNNLYVALNLVMYIVDYDFNYNYYYAYCNDEDISCDNDNLQWQQLYYEQFMLLDNGEAATTLHFNDNGYVMFKIVNPYDNEVVYSTSVHISALNTKEPDIDLSINYNSGNGTTIDEILLDTTYNIYKSDTTGYKCYYMFSAIAVEPQTSDFIETDCSAGRLYVARSNGFYYARITYNDEPVADITKEITEYGKLVSEIYDIGGDNSIFSKLLGGTSPLLRNFTEMNGPLSSIVSLPLKLGTFVYQFFYTPSNVCTPYDMGTIFNTHLVIGCVDLSILGHTLLTTIDIIFAGFFTITWGKFLYSLFRKIVLLKELDAVHIIKGGIF